jgi:ABC-type nitrate/sulfonate/bicarbonate transport system substrate-binding protein
VLDGSTNLFDAYQGGIFAASRQWAEGNAAIVRGYIKAYLAGLGWTLAPENRDAAKEVLLRNMPEIKPPVAGAVMNSLLSPKSGLTPNGEILMDGVQQVLALRTRYAGKPLSDPKRYIDLSYYNSARTA